MSRPKRQRHPIPDPVTMKARTYRWKHARPAYGSACAGGCGYDARELKRLAEGDYCHNCFVYSPRCSVEGCDRPIVDDAVINHDGLCREHLFPPEERDQNWRRSSSLHGTFQYGPDLDYLK